MSTTIIKYTYIDTAPDSRNPAKALAAVEDGYVSVKASSFKLGTQIPFEVFRDTGSGKELCVGKGTEYSHALRKALSHCDEAFVRDEDEEAYILYCDSLRLAPGGKVIYTQKEFERYNRDKEIHYPIARDMLDAGTKVNFSVLVKRGVFYAPLLLVERGREATITERHINAHGELVIVQEDIERYQDYIARRLNSCGNDMEMAAAFTRESAKLRVRETFGDYKDGKKVKKNVEDTVQDMLSVITSNQSAFAGLLSLNAQDTYTYVHSVNVAAMSISLGHALGLDPDSLFALGMGCLLHDIGKVMVPLEILNKPGRLTTREYREIRNHVIYGHGIVQGYSDIPEAASIPVLQHHEKLSGKGYPFSLHGEKIHTMGRIASMVDTYDAITTSRPYRRARKPFHALKVISNENENYAPELYSEFVKLLGRA